MSLKIENDFLIAEINLIGGEITSLIRRCDNLSIVWKKNKEVWGYQTPLLFPKIGSVSYVWQNKIYQFANHGFVRNTVFECLSHTKDSIALKLSSNFETRKVYPFDFEFILTYKLIKNSVEIKVDVINTGNTILPFEFGYHPAFVTYGMMRFQCTCGKQYRYNGLTKMEVSTMESENIQLQQEIFKKENTLIYSDIGNRYRLFSDYYEVEFEVSDFAYVALWSKNMEFVCVEPWTHIPDVFENTLNWTNRENIYRINPQEKKEFIIKMIVN